MHHMTRTFTLFLLFPYRLYEVTKHRKRLKALCLRTVENAYCIAMFNPCTNRCIQMKASNIINAKLKNTITTLVVALRTKRRDSRGGFSFMDLHKHGYKYKAKSSTNHECLSKNIKIKSSIYLLLLTIFPTRCIYCFIIP